MEQLKKEYERKVLAKKWLEADQLIFKFLIGYTACSLILAFFYDTWLLAISVSAINVGSYLIINKLAPEKNLHRYFASLAFGLFMALFIYQMHGLFEMHFFAFIGSAILVAYQQWRMQIPITLLVVLHHAIFGYLQYAGTVEVYFTQVEYMGLETFIIHVILAAIIFGICGLWAYRFKNYSIVDAEKSMELGKLNQKLDAYNKALAKTNQALAIANDTLQTDKEKLVNLTQRQAEINRQLIDLGPIKM